MPATRNPGIAEEPPSDLPERVLEVLYGLTGRRRGRGDEWVPECLVARELRDRPDALRSDALRAVLTAARERLAVESPELADLLAGRFWEGLSVEKMVEAERPRPWQDRNFQNQQRRAVARLAALLWEMESLCLAASGVATGAAHAAVPVAAPEDAAGAPAGGERGGVGALVNGGGHADGGIGRHRRRWTGVIALLAGVLGVAAIARWPSGWLQSTLLPAVPAVVTEAAPMARPAAPTGTVAGTAGMVAGPAAGGCGEAARVAAPAVPRLLRSQGVSAFSAGNTDGAVLSDWVRQVAVDARGVWLGYFSDGGGPNGLGHWNKVDWADCNGSGATAGMNVNDIVFDHLGRVWVAAERVGVAMFDGATWRRFTTADGLPSADTFGLTVDRSGDVWVGTWAGVAKYDGTAWSTPYAIRNGTLFDDQVHAVAFDGAGNVWVGHVNAGVSLRRAADGRWVHVTRAGGQIGGDEVRAIVVRPERGRHGEQVWFATSDGGVSVVEKGRWRVFTADDGAPGNDVRDLAIDRYDRVWAASATGVGYFDDERWHIYHTLDAFSVAVGADCADCPFDSDHVLTGTRRHGLTHSRIPLDTEAVEVVSVTYPEVVAPGERFVPEFVVAPITPFALREDRGDMLVNTDADDALLFGAYEHIAVKGVVDAGKAFIFSAPDTPMVAPELPAGVDEQVFTSSWRVWMHTRYVGPPMHVVFRVRR